MAKIGKEIEEVEVIPIKEAPPAPVETPAPPVKKPDLVPA